MVVLEVGGYFRASINTDGTFNKASHAELFYAGDKQEDRGRVQKNKQCVKVEGDAIR